MRRFISLISRLLFLALMAGVVVSCDLFGDEEGNEVQQKVEGGWVALTAVYAEARPSGAPIQRIVLVDFDDPSNYEVLTDTSTHDYVEPRFSPDKTRLLFRDRTVQAEDAGEQFVIYDLKKSDLQPIVTFGPEPFPLVGRGGVWNAEGTGFYFYHSSPFIPPSVLFHRLGANEVERIQMGAYAAGLKDRDSLIVFSNKRATPGCPDGCRFNPFYFMNLQGEIIGHLQNPHLELINRDGVNMKTAYSIAWGDERGLFTFAYSGPAFLGYKIAVTNLDGSYYREYTSGKYIDDHPRWGPEGKVILFDRRGIRDYEFTDYRTMVVNLETGQVREFVEPDVIDGAVALRFPDY